MFVNKRDKRCTIDEERGVELRFVASGPDRPNLFVLTVGGTSIAFEASVNTIQRQSGESALVWTIHAVGKGYPFHGLPAYRFADSTEHDSVLALINEAMRTYRDLHGMIATPVENVLFELLPRADLPYE